jgi:hypothetical protein
MSGFASEELGGLAHDFFRLLQGVRQYTSLKANKLNFPRDRTFLIRFSERNGMEKFRVVAEGEEKSWGVDKKKDFMELVATALGQIVSLKSCLWFMFLDFACKLACLGNLCETE